MYKYNLDGPSVPDYVDLYSTVDDRQKTILLKRFLDRIASYPPDSE